MGLLRRIVAEILWDESQSLFPRKIFSDREHPNGQRAHLNATWDGCKKQTHSEEAQFQLRGLFGRIEQPGLKILISQSSNWSKHKWLCSAYTWDYCADPKSWCCVYEEFHKVWRGHRAWRGLGSRPPKACFPFLLLRERFGRDGGYLLPSVEPEKKAFSFL